MNQYKNLIIGGVHKAGTTSLYTYLSWHPEVCASEIKETHFFSGEDVKFSGGVKHRNYSDFFGHCSDKKVRVESSPEYIYGKKEVAQRIRASLPNVKLVFILRNPVDKIVSSFAHQKKKLLIPENVSFNQYANEKLNFSSLQAAVESGGSEAKELLDASYIDFLPDWFDYFETSDIKILFFDDLVHSPSILVKEVCSFVGIDDDFYSSLKFTVENKSIGYKNPYIHRFALWLSQYIEPALRRSFMLKKALRKVYYAMNSKDQLQELDEATVERISTLYKDSNHKLRAFLTEKGYSNLPSWCI